MLRRPLTSTCFSTIRIASISASSTRTLLARRLYATPSAPLRPQLSQQSLESTGQRGSEGFHYRDEHPDVSKLPTAGGPASAVTGDWVLFHPVYTPEELKSVEVLRRTPKTLSDKLALTFVKLVRDTFDIVSGYKHKPLPSNWKEMTLADLKKQGYVMDESQWLARILFLESIAGVPGMAAATIRHLRSLRVMQRDAGWIHTLLEEAENERMHLMTFMTLRKPGLWLRTLILGAQGVFYNLFFFSYLLSPKTCHRFVGCLEEEAVITYTRIIEEMEAGRLPAWENVPAPNIARDYWRLAPNATLLDVMYAVRSDESTHRFVNHSLANLQPDDINPFAVREPDMFVKGVRPGFEREEAAEYAQKSREIAEQGGRHST